MDTTMDSRLSGEAPANVTTATTLAIATEAAGKDHSSIKLLSAYEVQAEIRLTYKGTLAWIRKHITPIGGTVRIGNRILVHQWAMNEVLQKLMWKGPRKKPSPVSGNIYKYVEGLKKRKDSQPRSKPKE